MSEADRIMAKRRSAADRICAAPQLFKICEACESVIRCEYNHCPNCAGYRFDESLERIVQHARAISQRPGETPESLL